MNALKLTYYFGERSRIGTSLLADRLLDIHARRGIRASTLLRGIQGFGSKHTRRTDRLLTLSEDLPLVSIAIDEPAKIQALASELRRAPHPGLSTIEGLRLLDKDEGLAAYAGETVKLTIHFGRHERIGREPAFAALCRLLRECGVAGATVMLGVDGTREGARERARFFARNTHVPMMLIAVGDAPVIERALGDVRMALSSALLSIERVAVCKRDGQLLQAPVQAASEKGWHKLTIVTSEAALHERRPVYAEIVTRLRSARCAGATSLRGIWGYHGDHAPHGDKLLSIRRHVPVVTEAIDTSERIGELFGIVDELTHERGLVTSEMLTRPPVVGYADDMMSPSRGCSSVG